MRTMSETENWLKRLSSSFQQMNRQGDEQIYRQQAAGANQDAAGEQVVGEPAADRQAARQGNVMRFHDKETLRQYFYSG